MADGDKIQPSSDYPTSNRVSCPGMKTAHNNNINNQNLSLSTIPLSVWPLLGQKFRMEEHFLISKIYFSSFIRVSLTGKYTNLEDSGTAF